MMHFLSKIISNSFYVFTVYLQVTLSARGVKLLVSLLDSEKDETKVLSASLLASLAHTRAGIPDAMIVAGKTMYSLSTGCPRNCALFCVTAVTALQPRLSWFLYSRIGQVPTYSLRLF